MTKISHTSLPDLQDLNLNEESTDLGNNEDNTETVEPALKALGTQVILRAIFKNLSTSELLTCSLVCTQWNYEARSAIRDFKVCYARIRGPTSCEDLRCLDATMSSMNVIPFNGLFLDISDNEEHSNSTCIGFSELGSLYPIILNSLPVKYLRIRWTGHQKNQSCPAVLLVERIIEAKAKSLEQLRVSLLPFRTDLLNLSVPSDKFLLPKLRTLEIAGSTDDFWLAPHTIPNFLAASPNLKEFLSTVDHKTFKNCPKVDLRIVRVLAFCPENTEDHNFYEAIAAAKPRLRSITVSTDRPEVRSRWDWSLLVRILNNSTESLEELSLNTVSAAMVLPRIVPLVQLRELSLTLDFSAATTWYRRIFTCEKFGTLFPQLTKVEFSKESLTEEELYLHIELVQDAERLDNRSEPPTVHTVVVSMCFSDTAVELLKCMFPDIHELRIFFYGEYATEICAAIFDDDRWQNVEKIRLFGAVLGFVEDEELDAVLCGIHAEEAKELRTKDSEFLKAVHIVPVRPCLVTLQRLKQLDVMLHPAVGGVPWPAVYPSHVTGYLAFARMPQLEVFVSPGTTEETRPNQLAPFVTFRQWQMC